MNGIRNIRAALLGTAALVALSGAASADGAPVSSPAVDLDQLAASAAPVLPAGSHLLTISKTRQPEVPGLPLSDRDLRRMSDNATTITILPATGGAPEGSVSWSGYTRAGVIYKGSN